MSLRSLHFFAAFIIFFNATILKLFKPQYQSNNVCVRLNSTNKPLPLLLVILPVPALVGVCPND